MSFNKFLKRVYGSSKKDDVVSKDEAKVDQIATDDQKADDEVEAEVVEDDAEDDTPPQDDDSVVDYSKMTKKELDAYALKKHDVKLDRRQSKDKMIDQFETEIEAKKEK